MVEIKTELGEVIRNLRLEAGLSQQALADRSGLKRAYIGIIERGGKAITVETAQKIASGLGVRLSSIFDRLENIVRCKEER
jgi:transcriptional regulator with XRE-family HTH domain